MRVDRLVAVPAGLFVLAAVDGVAFGLGVFDAPEEPTRETMTPVSTPEEPVGPRFTFSVDDIEECGLTCRNVTATLSNVGDVAATNVTVNTSLYTDGEEAWNGTRVVGEIGTNDSYTDVQEVTVDLEEARAIQENYGYVTIEVLVAFNSVPRPRFTRHTADTRRAGGPLARPPHLEQQVPPPLWTALTRIRTPSAYPLTRE